MALKTEKDENPFEPPIDEDFLKTALEYRDRFEDDEEFQEALAIWPRCPRCGRRRVARCPVCKTSGTLFPLGDREFWDFRSDSERERDAEIFDADERRSRACGPHSCSCGSSSCRSDDWNFESEEADAPNAGAESELDGQLLPGVKDWRRRSRGCGKTSDVFDDLPDKRAKRRAWAAVRRGGTSEKRRTATRSENEDVSKNVAFDAENATSETPELVVCFVCSEAFEPKFPRRCEWCDYEFEDGIDENETTEDAETTADVASFVARKELERVEAAQDEASSSRLFWTLLFMALGAAAICGYFAFVLR